MRPSLLSRGRRAAAADLCAACGASSAPSRRITSLTTNKPASSCSPYSTRPALLLASPLLGRVVPSSTSSTSSSRSHPSQHRPYSSSAAAEASPEQKSQSTEQSSSARTASGSGGDPIFYYDLFPQSLPQGPPPAGPFEIDVRALRREFLQLQAAAHPDFHHHAAASSSSPPSTTTDANATAETTTTNPRARYSKARLRAEAASALINEAYKTLSSPLLRAQYLLRTLHGIDLASDESGTNGSPPPDPELLMTVLEAREEIEDAMSEEDLAGVRAANEGRIRESEENLARAFAAGDVEGAAREAVRLRYWVNIRESVDNWEGPGRGVVLQH